MRKLLLATSVCLMVFQSLVAQQAFQPVPELPYQVVPNFFKFPKCMGQGEAVGVGYDRIVELDKSGKIVGALASRDISRARWRGRTSWR